MYVDNPFTPKASFNWDKLSTRLEVLVRMLDDVLDVTYWPLEEQGIEAANKRRIGAGFTGLGNALAMLNLIYGSPEALAFVKKLGETMRNVSYSYSSDLAKEKGSFPLFDADKYLEEGTFASRLPKKIKDKIRKQGIRNSHLLSIAPTGTVSLAFADNCSNGIEPPFSFVYDRVKRNHDGSKTTYQVIDKGLKVYLSTIEEAKADAILAAMKNYDTSFVYNNKTLLVKDHLPASLVTALELSTDAHITTPAVIKEYIDSAISKTINVPADTCFDDFSSIYDRAYASGLKGISTYRPNSILGSVLSVGKQEETIKQDPKTIFNKFMTDDLDKRPEGKLLGCSTQYTYYNQEGQVKFYVGVSFIDNEVMVSGNKLTIRRPIEIFINSEMNVGNEWSKLLGITLSQWARTSIYKFSKYLKTCLKMRSDRGSIRFGHIEKANGGKAPRYHGSDISVMAYAIQDLLYNEGIFDKNGNPKELDQLIITEEINLEVIEQLDNETDQETIQATGSICVECQAPSVIKKDGCKFCTNCGAEGACG